MQSTIAALEYAFVGGNIYVLLTRVVFKDVFFPGYASYRKVVVQTTIVALPGVCGSIQHIQPFALGTY
jgi:hypothetical protein